MSCYFQSGPAASAERRSFSWRPVFAAMIDRMRKNFARRKQRRELLAYIASDHRAAADIGIGNYNERELRE